MFNLCGQITAVKLPEFSAYICLFVSVFEGESEIGERESPMT